MALTFKLAALKDTFVGGEPFRLELTLENTGPGAIQMPDPSHPRNWQPMYLVTTPSNPRPWAFDRRRGRHHPSMSNPSREEAALLDLVPGEVWQNVVRVDGPMGLTEGGAYQIRGILEWGTVYAESNAVPFAFEELRLNGVGHGLWGNPRGSSIFIIWLHRREEGQILFQNYFSLSPGDDAIVRSSEVVRLGEVGPDAREPLTQETNHALEEDLFHWAFWKEGGDFVAVDALTRTRSPLGLGPGEMVLGPPFMDRDLSVGVWSLVQVRGGQSRLRLARFESPLREGPQPGRVVVEHELPAPAVAAGVAFDPPGGRNLRHAVALVPREADLVLYHLGVTGEGALEIAEAQAAGWLPGLEFLPDAPPAMIARSDGTTRVGFLARDAQDARGCMLFDVAIGDAAACPVTALELPSLLVAARIGYFEREDGIVRRSVALWTEDGRVYAADGRGLRVARESVDLTAARALIVLGDASYLLESSPWRGLWLAEL